jgi:hypothetical protein
MIFKLLRLQTLRKWQLYEPIVLSRRRYATEKAVKSKKDSTQVETWKRDLVLMLNSEVKHEHRRYAAQRKLLNHEHKVVW